MHEMIFVLNKYAKKKTIKMKWKKKCTNKEILKKNVQRGGAKN